jgi:DNA-binding MarR family transcriptional regulator
VELGAAALVLARLARVLEHACTDLSLAQYRVLATVAAGGERATQLAERLALAKPTVTAVVDGLVARGLLRRDEVASDRRAARLTITPEGRRALAAAERTLASRLGELFARAEDPDRAAAALADLGAALDRLLAERLGGRR